MFNSQLSEKCRPASRSYISRMAPEQEPLKLPYAVSNFEELRDEGYFFVDKTAFIRELERYKVPVFLRPRRFGKTLWCSTLECYYDILRKPRFEALFGDLAIGKTPTGKQNSFMVMRFNFSVVQVNFDLAELEKHFNQVCYSTVRAFLMRYQSFFQGRFPLDESVPMASSMARLLATIVELGLPPIYLIIDEYDNFVNQFITSQRDDLYKDLTTGDSFFRTFFKAIKAGTESNAIGKVFITGVLPITMDDLTSGFNIAEIVTLKKHLHNMLGFTTAEVADYLAKVIQAYGIDPALLPGTLQVVKNYYNGYRFLLDAPDSVYNSTILTYFLKSFAFDHGEYPADMIDPNVKTDVGWIERLGGGSAQALQLTETLLTDGGLPFDVRALSDRFNMNRFLDRTHYPVSLFFLGMLTVKDRNTLAFPNQTVAEVFANYFNILARVEVSSGYNDMFTAFVQDLDLGKLFAGYYRVYLGQIPAQAFDRINENFVRTTFFELCSRYLSWAFSFAIEVNYPSGRSDWEMLGRPEGDWRNQKWVVEFKYLPKSSGQNVNELVVPDPAAVAQVKAYAQDILASFPEYTIRTAVCVVQGRAGFKWFDV
jgi:hypothetical protein